MNEEINSPYVSSESPPLAAGKLADDKLTAGFLFPTLTLSCAVFPRMAPPVEINDFLITGFVHKLINWVGNTM